MVKLGDEEAKSHSVLKALYCIVSDLKFEMKDGSFGTAKSVGSEKDCWRWLESCSSTAFAGYIVFYIVYIALGGLIFYSIEGRVEEEGIFQKVQAARAKVLTKFPNASGETLDDFLSELSSMGVSGLQTLHVSEEKWTYSQAVLFCTTLLTTVGYGHVAPVSQLGKAVCMIYTAFGIPCTLMLLAGWVKKLTDFAFKVQCLLYAYLDDILKPLRVRVLFLTMAVVFVGVLFFFIPALVFSHLEKDWTFLDGLYFCFISLTTVGLGDLVPGRNRSVEHSGLYRVGVTCYLFAGITALMFLMGLLTQLQECVFKRQAKVPKAPYSWGPPTYGSIMPDHTILIAELKATEIKQDIHIKRDYEIVM